MIAGMEKSRLSDRLPRMWRPARLGGDSGCGVLCGVMGVQTYEAAVEEGPLTSSPACRDFGHVRNYA
jgi:hypothetical protein